MNRLALLGLGAAFLMGCDPAPVTETNANPLATSAAPSNGAPKPTTPTDTPVESNPATMPGDPAPAAPEASPEAQGTVAGVVNGGGKIDAGLPKTAAPGAKLPKKGDPIAILNTTKGVIVVKFFPSKAPKHVANFLNLSRTKFYDGTRFHRVIPGFMIQGGDPNTKDPKKRAEWGMGGPSKNVVAEFNDVPHTPGILSMARSQDPDSAGSQFFIMHGRNEGLDGQYTVFGQVIKGMDVVDKIVNVPTDGELAKDPVTLKKVTVAKWPVKL